MSMKLEHLVMALVAAVLCFVGATGCENGQGPGDEDRPEAAGNAGGPDDD